MTSNKNNISNDIICKKPNLNVSNLIISRDKIYIVNLKIDSYNIFVTISENTDVIYILFHTYIN